MEIYLNNQKQQIAGSALPAVLQLLNLGAKNHGYALAVNDTVVPRSEWNTFRLKEHDKVLLIKATQGG